MSAALLIYAAGAAVALWRTDASWPTRLLLAALWPIGPAAFVVTVTLLVVVALFVFPWFGLAVAAAVAAWLLLT